MLSKNLLFFGLLVSLTALATADDRVKLKEDIKAFLAALEPYEHTRNDLVFLLDESGSIGFEKFQEMKLFTKLIARQFSVSSEKTRVAVVPFATDTRVPIDYIKNPDGNNMCTLLRSIGIIDYAAEWTHTDKAMEKAEEILSLARRDSNKIIVLLTDGESNDGHSPVRMANILKSRGVIIFGVGVGNYKEQEILDVATSRNHTYFLRDFDYIEKVNKYLIEDVKEYSLDKVDSSLCESTCDAHAQCYCGARSGKYECQCNAGYQGKGGLEGQCQMCPKGTYKRDSGNFDCKLCPEHSTTFKEGRTSFDDCRCDIGYEKAGNFCLPLRCALLNAPEGGILIPAHCNNTFGTQCSFKCDTGYCPFSCHDHPPLPMDNHILPKRTCLETRKWSNEEFYCEKMTCPALSFPLNGMHNCIKDFTYGTTCTFKCEKGYELQGPESRTCGLKGWSGKDVTCKEIYCNKLKTNDKLHVKPPKCSANPMPYRSMCRYHCAKGYDLVLQGNTTDGVLNCEADKKWSRSFSKISCEDNEPPTITCPKSITVNTLPDKDFASVIWDMPNVTDNVEVKRVRIIEPKGLKKPPYAFPINETKVVYEAIDSSKLSKTCPFIVKVIDKEPPKVLSCPSNIEVYHHKNKPIHVTWDGPKFEDNSKYVSVTSDRKSGDEFAWGPASKVTYVASDSSKNNVSCTFWVSVKPYPCPYYDPPENGILTCDNWNDGRMCSIFCHDGFEFASSKNFHTVFLCNPVQINGVFGAEWQPFTKIPGFKMPWPDCVRKQKPTSVKATVGLTYSVDSCSEETLKKIREEFIKRAKKLPPILCPVKQGCSPENVNVTCTPATIRRKRSFDSDTHPMYKSYNPMYKHRKEYTRVVREASKVLTVSFNMLMFANETQENFDVDPSMVPGKDNEVDLSSINVIQELQDELSSEVKDVYNLPSVPEPTSNYGIVAICSTGQLSINNSCVNCPAGTYKDDVSEGCLDCPVASYQDEERHLSCKPCPVGYTTYGVKSKSFSDCKAPCQPGMYSKTTFEPCLTCPLNTYQERSSRKECMKCPSGLFTWKVGANSSRDCVAPCKPGSFSDTGYEPCSLCDVGSFQEKGMQKECTICPDRTSTSVKGSTKITDCKEIDICKELRPCRYNSTCIQLDKEYECVCPEGLTGKHCEVNSDDCESGPCLNNGTCTDGIGNFSCSCPDGWEGQQCEINQDDCNPNPCFNGGECLDKINAYSCRCLAGFTGDRCEWNLYECQSNPCLNNGTCFDMINDYRCCCPEGYFGKSCENKLNASICDSVTCKNGGTCVVEFDGFNCSCPDGFEGEFCESSIDKCKEFECENGGTCIDGFKTATCTCPSKFFGVHCELAATPEFLLSFPKPDTTNYAVAENNRNLYAITVSFFMRTSFQDPESRATPVSYSYKYQGYLQDNALTLLDTNSFVLYVHGQAFHTEYSANKDALWHHYAVTWQTLDGKWVFYVDGQVIESGHVGKGKYLHPGTFILGQEQDDLGGKFSLLEAFVGDITEFNVWDYALSENEIKSIQRDCGNIGNVIPWYVLSQSVYGNVIISQDVDKCRDIGTCSENSCDCFYTNETEIFSCKHKVEKCIDENTCWNNHPCITNEQGSFCNCSSGFEGSICEYDVNECLEENGGCNYICVNDIGSYHCECPNDMFLSDDGKTCKDTSYCVKEGQIYVNGDSWVDSCQNCICDNGIVSCEEIKCNETACYPEETLIMSPGECCPKCVAWSFCLISPNNTLMSFDMSSYHIEGECTYTAVEDCTEGRFKIQVEFAENSVDQAKLVIYQDCYKVVVSSNGSVLVDDSIVALPFQNEELIAEHINSSITVKTNSDLLVQWDLAKEAVIAVPITDVHKLCGVCNTIEHYLTGTGKFPLTERFASGEKECVVIKEGFEETVTISGSLSIFPSSHLFPVIWTVAFMCLLTRSRSVCFY